MSSADTSPSSRVSVVPPTVSSPTTGASLRSPLAIIGDDRFVAEALVDGWLRSGVATRAGGVLRVKDGRVVQLREAVRVLGRRNGDTDPYGFTGRVEAIRELIRRGASISADALRLGPAVYDIEYGYIVTPDGA